MMLDQGMKYELIYTAQHRETIDEILQVYNLPKPDKVIYHRDEANTKGKFLKWFITCSLNMFLHPKKWLPEKGIVLTHGDTFTAWMAAIMGRLAGCKVGHIESGLRSFNLFKPFPEEISRLITFCFSTVYFCPGKWAVCNLKRYKGEKIDLKMNPLYDAVNFALKKKKHRKYLFLKKKYIVVSVHRYENIFSERLEKEIIPLIEKMAERFKVVITLHPTTRERLKSLNLYEKLSKNKNIELSPRFDFVDWINICQKSQFVMTDGGSNQEELFYLGVPTLLLRSETERKEGLGGNVVLSKFDKRVMDDFANNYNNYRKQIIKVKESPSQIIINYLKRHNTEKLSTGR
jgi:UDP-N-acetylglucosamine 2-epimerase (non-hydrolysing)